MRMREPVSHMAKATQKPISPCFRDPKFNVGDPRKAPHRACDNCGKTFHGPGRVRRLDLGGNSGIDLCRTCWQKEMAWRKLRNKTLKGDARFPILKFPE